LQKFAGHNLVPEYGKSCGHAKLDVDLILKCYKLEALIIDYLQLLVGGKHIFVGGQNKALNLMATALNVESHHHADLVTMVDLLIYQDITCWNVKEKLEI